MPDRPDDLPDVHEIDFYPRKRKERQKPEAQPAFEPGQPQPPRPPAIPPDIRQRLDEMQLRLQERETELAQARSQAEAWEAQLQRAQQTILELQRAEKVADAERARADRLQVEVASLGQQLLDRDAALEQARLYREAFQNELEEAQRIREHLEGAGRAIDEENETALAQFEQQLAERDALLALVQTRAESLTKELAAARVQIQQLGGRVEESEALAKTREQGLAQAREEFARETQKREAAAREAAARMERLQRDLSEGREQISDLRGRLKKTEEQASRIGKLDTERNKLLQELDKQRAATEAARRRAESLEREVSGLRDSLSRAERQAAELERKHSSEFQAEREQLQKTLHDRETQLAQAQVRVNSLSKELETAAQAQQKLQAELESLRGQAARVGPLDSGRQQLEQQLRDRDASVREAQSRVESLRAELDSARAETAELRQTLQVSASADALAARLQAENDQLTKQMQALRAEAEQALDRTKGLEQQLATANERLTRLESLERAAQERETQFLRLRDENQKIYQELQANESALKQARGQQESQLKDLIAARDQIARLEKAAREGARPKARAGELEAERKRFEQQLAEHARSLETERQQRATLERELRTAQESLARLQTTAKLAQESAARVRELETEKQKLDAELLGAQAQLAGLQTELEKARSAPLAGAPAGAEGDQLAAMRSNLAALHQERETLLASMETARVQSLRLREQMAQYAAERDKLARELDASRNERDQLRSRSAELETLLATAQTQVPGSALPVPWYSAKTIRRVDAWTEQFLDRAVSQLTVASTEAQLLALERMTPSAKKTVDSIVQSLKELTRVLTEWRKGAPKEGEKPS